jgi:hypothetical protein
VLGKIVLRSIRLIGIVLGHDVVVLMLRSLHGYWKIVLAVRQHFLWLDDLFVAFGWMCYFQAVWNVMRRDALGISALRSRIHLM